ncbi:DUF7220 family protein [Azospirillum argentinense]|uniref:Uncharacterized protein n=1 Tax=Azospirillum brasilense TaxID=192 RepID=A0A4D8Q860_AZOBR|nr:hypothetical protein [Azospirillum argentinense]QCO05473.1 hypothetical protein D3867_26380 [Azospirillum argentinense]
MSQSRLLSGAEACANTASGFALSWMAGMIVYPMLGWPISAGQNTAVVLVFTAISLLRSYLWRRLFNRVRSC